MNKKVLIIEDDEPYRKIYSRKFELSGYAVETAGDGVTGLEKMRIFRPDIALVDLMMPRMDGFQVIDQVKADPALQHIPIVVLTNLSTSEDAKKVLEKGAASVIIKSDVEPGMIVQWADKIIAGEL